MVQSPKLRSKRRKKTSQRLPTWSSGSVVNLSVAKSWVQSSREWFFSDFAVKAIYSSVEEPTRSEDEKIKNGTDIILEWYMYHTPKDARRIGGIYLQVGRQHGGRSSLCIGLEEIFHGQNVRRIIYNFSLFWQNYAFLPMGSRVPKKVKIKIWGDSHNSEDPRIVLQEFLMI